MPITLFRNGKFLVLPGGKGVDAGLLLEQIRRVSQSITQNKRNSAFNFHFPDFPIFSRLQEFFNQNRCSAILSHLDIPLRFGNGLLKKFIRKLPVPNPCFHRLR